MAWPGFGFMIGKQVADTAISNMKKRIEEHEQKNSVAASTAPQGANNNAGQRTEVHIGGPGVAVRLLTLN